VTFHTPAKIRGGRVGKACNYC